MPLFGLQLAPIIFTAVGDTLEWIFRQQDVEEIDHYLDDFITVGPSSSQVSGRKLDIILQPARSWAYL